ncbi:helix-turn-helix transcriptional regulator [Marinilongibacter aquaticus]|uniref:winged helix-turn-helix transcriptional regulator n=1 Tax=Marinilongibacter aquaticus TaxID=2975157 RepID=UPI0021BDB2A3|nr:helix-turn-helix domain-containing protein [Marinilongibacter aquaticus]UBM58605.1 helix-turn-helix transcriptional regulator [Marinilongibacter aquaticus]
MQKYSDLQNEEGKEDKAPMKQHFGNYMLPIRDALEIFGGKWKIPIITALSFYDTCGFKELEKIIEGITPKMLSKELKFLEENMLVTRQVKNTRPIKVEYSITEYGKTCSSVMRALYRWGIEHRKKILDIETEEQTWKEC